MSKNPYSKYDNYNMGCSGSDKRSSASTSSSSSYDKYSSSKSNTYNNYYNNNSSGNSNGNSYNNNNDKQQSVTRRSLRKRHNIYNQPSSTQYTNNTRSFKEISKNVDIFMFRPNNQSVDQGYSSN
ncbi:hypothetical protein DiNV_CH01M_ORF102 [Drosophila innubila nudivirus]|uniref:Uncharacterized protein n=1 Tax=Drosophila innubila nudivirus TaxID=2057187 RepID=A0A2H4UX89_9VIRU|nr:hypothetical protein DiNV_CH01M_ORF102 [Drosophila innubila nudivirus]ATZ81530.1 hypothetical protein DiNV_CH01M_ORF102 [Drosophila innubila nudivirus]